MNNNKRFIIHSGPGIGDVIQFLSMARDIKRKYPDAQVDLLMRGSESVYKLNKQIIDCQDYVNEIYWYSAKEIKHDISLLSELKKNQYDYGFVRIGNVTGRSSLWIYRIMRLAGCKTIIGIGIKKADKYVELPEHTHYLVRNCKMLESAGIDGEISAIAINKNKLDTEWADILFEKNKGKFTVALSFGTNAMTWKEGKKSFVYDVKSWGYENWIDLANKLSSSGMNVLLIGGNKEVREIESEGLELPEDKNICNLLGKTDIKHSISALAVADLAVGSEGGMMHCASSVGTKTLTIFGGSDYGMWNPGGPDEPMMIGIVDCNPCFCTATGAHCRDHRCLKQVTVDKVVERITTILSQ